MMIELGWVVVAVILSFVAGVSLVAWRVNKGHYGLLDDLEKEVKGYRGLILKVMDHLSGWDKQVAIENVRKEIKRFLDDPMNWN